MRVSLVVPNVRKHIHGETFEPLGVLYLAAAIRDCHDVQIVDAFNRRLDLEATFDELMAFGPDVVGISLTMSPTAPFGRDLAARLKQAEPTITTVMGGTHATFAAETLAASPHIDAVVTHDGEQTLAQVLRALERGDGLSKIRGIVFAADGRIHSTGLPPLLTDLDRLRFPARDLLPDDEAYARRHVLSSRGCVFRCIYCAASAMNQHRWRFRSADNVLDEVELLASKHSQRFYFADDNFPVKRERVMAICRGIRERALDVEWSCLSRVEFADDPELLRTMAESGCRQVFLGAESGSRRVLKAMKRSYTGEDVKRVVGLCAKVRMEATVSFIIGSPWEQVEDVRQTFALARELATPNIAFHIFTPYIGTEAFNRPHRYGLEILSDDPEQFDKNTEPVLRTRHLSEQQIMDLYCESFGISLMKARQRYWA